MGAGFKQLPREGPPHGTAAGCRGRHPFGSDRSREPLRGHAAEYCACPCSHEPRRAPPAHRLAPGVKTHQSSTVFSDTASFGVMKASILALTALLAPRAAAFTLPEAPHGIDDHIPSVAAAGRQLASSCDTSCDDSSQCDEGCQCDGWLGIGWCGCDSEDRDAGRMWSCGTRQRTSLCAPCVPALTHTCRATAVEQTVVATNGVTKVVSHAHPALNLTTPTSPTLVVAMRVARLP